jgi:hypothetical protein
MAAEDTPPNTRAAAEDTPQGARAAAPDDYDSPWKEVVLAADNYLERSATTILSG